MNQTLYQKDLAAKKMTVTRDFEAPVDLVWRAWTESEILDLWWAPKPWKARTKTMDFRNGGFWLYCMVGPDGTESWARADYNNIIIRKRFEAKDAFCDDQGNPNTNFPTMEWNNQFTSISDGTRVHIEITFADEADIQKIIDLGFQEGFRMAHDNLDEYLRSAQR